ncbi:nuclear factor of activated T-cells, cytoplasmic 3-like isoform X2 [Conger conger]|uniref:nuclear factor of activated T-cells, cytoplasmic 3-like isoform X2 n=1 Tax=Conger conger TaxID=82655 RepID=UPI002A5A4020|nr:nuclear factor of activated T-cells, cytoplasmic 3-like isoform X2 [Conger conger]
MLCVTSQDLEPDDNSSFYIVNVGQPQTVPNQPIGVPRHGPQTHAPLVPAHRAYDSAYEPQGSKYGPLVGRRAFECPSIQITSISPSCLQDMEAGRGVGREGEEQPLSRGHLYLPLDVAYRDASLSPSPCSSLSSRSWFSDASSCGSFSPAFDDVETELNEAAARFTLGSPLASPADEPWPPQPGLPPLRPPALLHSPRASVTDENWLSPRPPSRPSSRPASPCGKRRHSSAELCHPGPASPRLSPAPTPGASPRGSVTEDSWAGYPSVAGPPPFHCCSSELDVPSKTRKTSPARPALCSKADPAPEDPGSGSPSRETPAEDPHGPKKDGPPEQFLSVPSHLPWSKPKPGHTPIFRASSLPPLDWPLPSQFGQYELQVEVHPKAHHRAHYETEGSRGAVKAASGGHPVVKLIGYNEKPVNLQMFIGTADDRYLRPHAFYQVHRITGKTVATPSQEIIITSTKVLEIPLLPENNMSASIDCAGILKLRNSDIELRKGETDIGRKNTRVRAVFRVHVPQPGGKVLSLQAASIPVECSQRSAQELPQVDRCSLTSGSVNGGEDMVITGSNFFPESRVVFLEKAPDGRAQWEADAKVTGEKSKGASIVAEVPPYHNKSVTSAIQVQFYVCNGKRKRSQSQRFTYLPVLVKQEQRDEQDVGPAPSMGPAPSVAPPRPLAPPLGQPGLQLLRTQLPPPAVGPVQDSLLASSSSSSSSFQHLPPLQGSSLSPGSDCQLMGPPSTFHPPPAFHPALAPTPAFHPAPAPPAGPSYRPMRHSLPMGAVSPQAYERLPYRPDPTASHPLGLAMVYHPPGSASSSTLSQSLHSHTPPHLHSLGYHCPGVPRGSSPSHPMAPPTPQLGYHSGTQRSASNPCTTTSPLPMGLPSCSNPCTTTSPLPMGLPSCSNPCTTTSPLPMGLPSCSNPCTTTSPLPMGLPSCSNPCTTTSPLPMGLPSCSNPCTTTSPLPMGLPSCSNPCPTTSPLPMGLPSCSNPCPTTSPLPVGLSCSNPCPTTSPLPMGLPSCSNSCPTTSPLPVGLSCSNPCPTTSPLPVGLSCSNPCPTTSPLPVGLSCSNPCPTTSPLPVGLSCSNPCPTTSPLPVGPSSPPLHSLPYRSPAGSSPSPTLAPSSPLVQQPSPLDCPLERPLAPQPTFAPEGETQDIKQEPGGQEPTFRSIGLQDITLDDGKIRPHGAPGLRSLNASRYSTVVRLLCSQHVQSPPKVLQQR